MNNQKLLSTFDFDDLEILSITPHFDADAQCMFLTINFPSVQEETLYRMAENEGYDSDKIISADADFYIELNYKGEVGIEFCVNMKVIEENSSNIDDYYEEGVPVRLEGEAAKRFEARFLEVTGETIRAFFQKQYQEVEKRTNIPYDEYCQKQRGFMEAEEVLSSTYEFHSELRKAANKIQLKDSDITAVMCRWAAKEMGMTDIEFIKAASSDIERLQNIHNDGSEFNRLLQRVDEEIKDAVRWSADRGNKSINKNTEGVSYED